MVCCSNRLCSCSVHCRPNDCLVRSDRVSERRMTGSPSSIGKLARHSLQSKFPEMISPSVVLTFRRERSELHSGQRMSASKLLFIEGPFSWMLAKCRCHSSPYRVRQLLRGGLNLSALVITH